jgi:co-chaperonin GroES (HSP10)
MNNGGDVLARGARSAQFAAGGSELSDFEYDLRTRIAIVAEKYGLSTAEIEEYTIRLNAGERLDLKPIALVNELGAGITVIDRRPSYSEEVDEAKSAPVVAKKYPEKKFSLFKPILDRILIKRCAENADMKLLPDGSVLNTKTNLVIAAKYRQHSNIGIVLAAGKLVILGGQRIPMEEVVRVGDRVTYGDYNSEVFHMDENRVKELCDAVQMNYEEDAEGLRVVRVQDVRGVETETTETEPDLSRFGGAQCL